MSSILQVIKRGGNKEDVSKDKLTKRLQRLSQSLRLTDDNITIAVNKIIEGLCEETSTVDVDILASEVCASLMTTHIDYQRLAGKIVASKIHRETKERFSHVISDLFKTIDINADDKLPAINDDLYNTVMYHADLLDGIIQHDRDYEFDYLGLKTLEKTYLLRLDGKVVERPQHLFMRVAIGIHMRDIEAAIETYELISDKWFIHATPTLCNMGRRHQQLCSCFLVTMREDSIEGIYHTLTDCAVISKSSGGIGLNIHCVRSSGSLIRSVDGPSNGIIPMLQVFNHTARHVHQGGNKRPGAFAIYLEPWHADIMEFIKLRRNHGDMTKRTLDLFLGLWVPDLFMKRLQSDGDWTLMDPRRCPGLSECWGDEFEKLYERYEEEGKGVRVLKIRDIWKEILDSQMETGTPYILYKDSCNSKSNHQNLGTIKCANLCTEIIQYSSPEEVAVCNLASISLPRFVNIRDRSFDFEKLVEVVGVVTANLDKIIDINHYPLEEARRSNMRNRPIGLGVQGLADVFAMLRYPFASPEAAALNCKIFEAIYFGALKKSCELASRLGPYESYEGSPMSRGILQPDMWGAQCSMSLDWTKLRSDISKYGVRNSLLTAAMPTASTAQILGNNECMEPFINNVYLKRVLSGEFVVVNKYLVEDLMERGLWSDQMKNLIIANRGSLAQIEAIPGELKELYKTVWEILQSVLIKMSADRAPFIDQSQSLSLYLSSPNYQSLTYLHISSWKRGLKTGMYYLRTRPAADPIQFTIDKTKLPQAVDNTGDDTLCSSCHG